MIKKKQHENRQVKPVCTIVYGYLLIVFALTYGAKDSNFISFLIYFASKLKKEGRSFNRYAPV